jgi:hypothetical protein
VRVSVGVQVECMGKGEKRSTRYEQEYRVRVGVLGEGTGKGEGWSTGQV